MSPDDRTKELVRYRIKRFRLFFTMLIGLIWREDAAIWSLLQEDDHA